MSTTDKTSEELWEELGDECVDDDECIERPFHGFPTGTHREEIWHFLEDRDDNFSVAKAMGVTNET